MKNRIQIVLIMVCLIGGLIAGLNAVLLPFVPISLNGYVLSNAFKTCEGVPLTATFDGSERQRCYTKVAISVLRRYGLPILTTALRIYIETPSGNILEGQRCHALAHEIGNDAARRGVSPHELLTQCLGMCQPLRAAQSVEGIDYGCLNGAAHTWVLLSASTTDVAKKCDDARVPLEIRNGCYHGIGHGLSEKYGGDVLTEISACAQIPIPEARYQCSHAVFMEKESLLTSDGLPVDVVSYCQKQPPEIASSCWEFAGFMNFTTAKNISQALTICQRAPDDWQSRCRERVGESLYITTQDPSRINACFGYMSDETADCLNGFVQASIDNVNDFYGAHAFAACESLPTMEQQSCFEVAGRTLLVRYGDATRKTSCRSLTSDQAKTACLQGQ